MNTWGLGAINNNSFNHYANGLEVDREARDSLLTYYKVHNLVLNILGYIPMLSVLSGMFRMGSGLAAIIVSGFNLLTSKKNDKINAFSRELLLTGMAQVARGALEAIVPFGWAVNASLDFGATFYNMKRHSKHASISSEDPDYPHVFKILYAV